MCVLVGLRRAELTRCDRLHERPQEVADRASSRSRRARARTRGSGASTPSSLGPANDRPQEYFCDYSPLTSSHFSLSLLPTPLHPSPHQRTMALYGETPSSFSSTSPALSRHVEGLSAVLLSLKKRPIIRYERMSAMAHKLGKELLYAMNDQQELWDFRKTATTPLLLILDRRNDPVTPLLSQWTYQAMVHELIEITNGRVSMAEAVDVREEMKVRFSSGRRVGELMRASRRSCCRRIRIRSLRRGCTTTLGIWERTFRRTCRITRIGPPARARARSRRWQI